MAELNVAALTKACSEARGLAMDAVKACKSGHLGLPLGSTEIGAVLFGHALRHMPEHPDWPNRDYFILSAGHGSMFLYSWLHLSGYALPIEEIKRFRQMESRTPGHPEFQETVGVECTTGPLGQGVGNAVGVAVACKMAAAHFNTKEHTIFNQKVVVLAGDGCLQEGVASEASAFAGHFKLDNLIVLYDSNDVTLDAMANATQSEVTTKRYEAYGFDTQIVRDGNDLAAILKAYETARNSKSGRPQFIEIKTLIAKGIPQVAGTSKGHGESGAGFVDEARKALGLPQELFYVSKETHDYFAEHRKRLGKEYAEWQTTFAAWKTASPDLAKLLASAKDKPDFDKLSAAIPTFPNAAVATRAAGRDALQPVAKALPLLISGSADLHGSTLNYINGAKDFAFDHHDGKNIRFGIREHGMGAMLNGFAYHGIFRPSGATFLVFADYLRPSIRLAALCHLPVLYIFTHDSVGVGEDGPTHQPVETVSGLRVIPQLDVIRPADPEETAGAFAAAMEHTHGPTLLALTRQAVPYLAEIDVQTRRKGVYHGAYVAKKETGDLKVILMASGSEVQHCFEAAKKLGDGVRIVSVPCTERFDRQTAEYKESVLPTSCRKRVAIEAGVTPLWYKYVGLDGKVVGIDRFGISAPGNQVMEKLGINADSVVKAAQSLL